MPPVEPPTAVSISPNSGAGYNQLFQFRFSDSNGAGDIAIAEVRFQQNGRACVVFANPASGRVSLQFLPEGGPGLRVTGNAGSLGRIENTVCSVDLSGASLHPSETDLIVSLPITFNASFDGPKQVTSQAWGNAAGQRANAPATGSWTVGPSQQPTPKP